MTELMLHRGACSSEPSDRMSEKESYLCSRDSPGAYGIRILLLLHNACEVCFILHITG